MFLKQVVIIGGGIIGAALARTLSRYDTLSVHLVEKELDVGWGCSKANSGILHPGHEDDPERFPLRAQFCVQGNMLWQQSSPELDIPVKWPGELMIARTSDEEKQLEEYMKIGTQNGVQNLSIIDADQTRQLEPNITPDVMSALWAPNAGFIEPWEAVIGLTENAVDNGVLCHLNTTVTGIHVSHGSVTSVETNKKSIPADIIINAAGLSADSISQMAGVPGIHIHPRKGSYVLFSENAVPRVQRIIHRVPEKQTKGVYVLETKEGNLMLGPTAVDMNDDEKENRATDEQQLEYIWEHAKTLVHTLPSKQMIAKTFAGVRAEPQNGQYVIKAYDDPFGFVNVAGIRSPGLTAAPAIAEYVTQTLIQQDLGINLHKKSQWNPYRKRFPHFSKSDEFQKKALIASNPLYGHIVCMCKEVTEAEVIAAMKRVKSLGEQVTLDSIKFRTTAMFGFCQGSYCRVKIARILSRELDIPLWAVLQIDAESSYGIGYIKTLQTTEEQP